MSLVKVYTDIGEAKPVILIAKIFKKVKKNVYQIKYLSPTTQKCNGHTIFAYENAVYEVDEDSITEHLNTDNEEVVGFKKNEYGFTKITPDDSDYEPSETGDSDSESDSDEESLVDSSSEVAEDVVEDYSSD